MNKIKIEFLGPLCHMCLVAPVLSHFLTVMISPGQCWLRECQLD
jgi:hypothetical protein